MKIQGTGRDRKLTVQELESATGTKRTYLGAPTFTFTVGDYSILRDGSVEVPDESCDMEVIRSLVSQGLLESPEEPDSLTIELPLEGHDGTTLMNLINMIHSRQFLLNQSVGRPGAFHIDEAARQKLAAASPETAPDFAEKMAEIGADKFRGIIIGDRIRFTGFPLSEEPEVNQAHIRLAALMNAQAKEKKRVSPKTADSVNQKYSFRVWLINIGMAGPEYKETRKVLLKNLTGHSAFRTAQQAEAFKARMKEKREKEKEAKCEEFHPL